MASTSVFARVSIAIFLIFSVRFAAAQNAPSVHLYLTGHQPAELKVWIDGHDGFMIHSGKIATFSITPGYHEITVGLRDLHGKPSVKFGTVALHAAIGDEYYVHGDYEFSAIRLRGGPNAVQIMVQEEQGAPPDLKEQILKPAELEQIAAIRPVESVPQARAPLPVATIPESQVEAAVLQGTRDPNPQGIGLYLNDVETAMFSGLADNGQTATSGFSIIIYSPFHWIEYQAAFAHHELRPFTVDDVTPEMRADVLHIVALPNTPDSLTGAGMSASSGVERIVVCDRSKTNTVQPLAEQSATTTVDSALRSKDYTKLASVFNRAEVERLRDLDKRREFFVVVIGDSGARKFFDIKAKYAAWL
jgi:hypothetical protein